MRDTGSTLLLDLSEYMLSQHKDWLSVDVFQQGLFSNGLCTLVEREEPDQNKIVGTGEFPGIRMRYHSLSRTIHLYAQCAPMPLVYSLGAVLAYSRRD
jgi:hypothetical protein